MNRTPTKVFRRFSSSFFFPPIKKTVKYVQHPPRELEKQRIKRSEKAERDEYMDIGLCLGSVKTWVLFLMPEMASEQMHIVIWEALPVLEILK
jgi:hypothetical protein